MSSPAINILIGDPDTLAKLWDGKATRDIDGTPTWCPGCPFASEEAHEPWEDIQHDPTEAHYDCRLLDRVVWGEYSPCSREDWEARAREELQEL